MDTPVAYRAAPARSHLGSRLIRSRFAGRVCQTALQFRTEPLVRFETPRLASRTNPLTQSWTVTVTSPQFDDNRNRDQLQLWTTNIFHNLPCSRARGPQGPPPKRMQINIFDGTPLSVFTILASAACRSSHPLPVSRPIAT